MNVQVRKLHQKPAEKQIDAHKLLTVANDLFLKGRFEEVTNLCKVAIDSKTNVVYSGLNREQKEEERGDRRSDNHEARHSKEVFLESVSLFAIQAFAEMDQWKEVEPFLLQCFENHHSFPPKVVQVCIMLYSRVSCYELAEYMTSQWLSSAENLSNQHYCLILQEFLSRILLPQNKIEAAINLVEATCSSTQAVDPETRLQLLQKLKETQAEKEESEKDSTDSKRPTLVVSLVEKISIFLSRFFPPTLRRLAVFGFFLYVLLFRTNLNVMSYTTSTVISRGVIQAWRALFAPFHMMSS